MRQGTLEKEPLSSTQVGIYDDTSWTSYDNGNVCTGYIWHHRKYSECPSSTIIRSLRRILLNALDPCPFSAPFNYDNAQTFTALLWPCPQIP